MLITNSLLVDLWIAVATLFIAAYIYIKHKYNYWIKRGVPQITPTFPFGNHSKELPRGISLGAQTINFYNEFKKSGLKLGGVYMGVNPYIVVIDPLYAKDVLVKDFKYFVDRDLYLNKNHPLTVNVLSQRGEEWKRTRAKFTSIFTSSKMKFFFKTMTKCTDDLKQNLNSYAGENVDINIYEHVACYFTDIIGSVVFGVEANSFQHPDAIFRKMGRDLFGTFSLRFQIKLFLTICYPAIAKIVGVSAFQTEIEKFFFDFVPGAIKHRKENNIYREDFLQLLIELSESGIDLSNEEIVAQSFLFFTAGFETSSGSSMMILFELAQHPEVQNRVREEINTALKKHNGEFTYELIQELTYLNQVFDESARKYPLLATLARVCVQDYKFRNSDVIIEKGTGVILPVLGYHRDPEVFPDPMKWDPDRFEDKDVKYEGYFPFGDGPRNCIGARLGIMQVKLCIATIIQNFEVFPSPKTKQPLEYDPRTFVVRMTQEIFIRLKKIEV